MISRVNSFTLSVLISCSTLAALPVSADQGPPTLPLVFEENRGQFDDPIDFVVRANGYTGFLSAGDLHLQLEPSGAEQRPSSVVFEIDGAADSLACGESPLPGRSNYLRGSDPKQWLRGVPHFAKVRYPAVYPGVDLVYRNADGVLQYDFHVAPGAEPGQIGLDVTGAESLRLDNDSRLIVETASGTLRQPAPFAFQRRPDGGLDRVAAAFLL